MGTEFWWFYDTVSVAVVLVCAFLLGKKGLMKGAIIAIGCAISVILAFALSGGIAENVYNSTARGGNINKIEKDMRSDAFIKKYCAYLEDMGYFISVSNDKVEKIFKSDKELDAALCHYVNNVNSYKAEENETVLLEKVREGYAEVMADIILKSLNKFSAETAARCIMEDSSGIKEVVVMMMDFETHHDAAVYIVDNYTAGAYITIFRLVIFVVLYLVILLFILAMINTFTQKGDSYQSPGMHIAGGLMGVVTGGVMTFAVAAIIRLWAIFGNNEMLFFNSDVIDKTIVFKYFFDMTLKM